jgi:deazaflavin-dependent oxidoreductase (nitroreductase family)
LSAPVAELVSDSPIGWVRRHIRRYVETDGRSGHDWNGHNALLITTRGRKSGRLRRTALIYGIDSDRYIVVASGGGEHHHPAWYLNLVAHPAVAVQIRGETFLARARTATPGEKPRLWRQMVELFPKYEGYQAKTTRDIPVVILEPIPHD